MGDYSVKQTHTFVYNTFYKNRVEMVKIEQGSLKQKKCPKINLDTFSLYVKRTSTSIV